MNDRDAVRVDDYIVRSLVGDDLDWVTTANARAGLPGIDVSPAQGKFLALLVRMTGAKKVLEVGTLGGYSSIWMAGALPEGGHLTTLEYDPLHARTARANIERAGLSGTVTVIQGAAAETMPGLTGPFDLIFIDADKPSNPTYLREALRLSRPGTVVVLDNVVRGGAVTDDASSDPSVIGTREAFAMMAAEPRFSATALQTVGAKGWDGFAVMVVD